ncbi:uncharacterized protein TRIREDRAFT_109475 [Trichoderma reesei QM6a]|uniref:Predicted protein n=1 Tax=Hypocrea jecorina (strain QM6a) TaxID=431241 RepID=G0RPZ5_HYPJQ|nr:uncharacterized protein TRIREDRAFT_109475 [Trichoderma reesei QM6a]EGR46726.1 predicted protein [Trichoderma reesei QM6a]
MHPAFQVSVVLYLLLHGISRLSAWPAVLSPPRSVAAPPALSASNNNPHPESTGLGLSMLSESANWGGKGRARRGSDAAPFQSFGPCRCTHTASPPRRSLPMTRHSSQNSDSTSLARFLPASSFVSNDFGFSVREEDQNKAKFPQSFPINSNHTHHNRPQHRTGRNLSAPRLHGYRNGQLLPCRICWLWQFGDDDLGRTLSFLNFYCTEYLPLGDFATALGFLSFSSLPTKDPAFDVKKAYLGTLSLGSVPDGRNFLGLAALGNEKRGRETKRGEKKKKKKKRACVLRGSLMGSGYRYEGRPQDKMSEKVQSGISNHGAKSVITSSKASQLHTPAVA